MANEWISVKDRLPIVKDRSIQKDRSLGRYLCCFGPLQDGNFYITVCCFTEDLSNYFISPDEPHAGFFDFDDDGCEYEVEPDYWMPIPEPPKKV